MILLALFILLVSSAGYLTFLLLYPEKDFFDLDGILIGIIFGMFYAFFFISLFGYLGMLNFAIFPLIFLIPVFLMILKRRRS